MENGDIRDVTWRDEWTDRGETDKWLAEMACKERAVLPGALRCRFHTRLVIPGRMVPSGRRYVANPGQVIPIDEQDRETLLSMTRRQDGCSGCGGSRRDATQPYFEEVPEG